MTFDIIIIGSGIVGSTLALALAQKTSLKIAVLDAHSPQATTRVSAISPALKKIFSELNLWQKLPSVNPYTKMQVWDATSNGEICFESQALGLSALGYIVEDQVLRVSLHESFPASVSFFHPVRVQALHETSAGFTVNTDTMTLQTKLVIAADGANSWVRENQGIAIKTWDYDHTAIVATVKTELPHQQTAWQRFLPSGPLAFLPLNDPCMASIVWSTLPEVAEELMQLNEVAFCRRLGEAFEHRLGNVIEVSPRQSFPLQMRHAKQYVKNRLALVGDAAHTIHPLAGLGVNMGVQDAWSLVEVIMTALAKHRDFSSFATLRRYERKRKNDNLILLAGVEGLKRLFASEISAVQRLRGAGLKTVNHLQFLKNFFAQYAIGDEGCL